MNLEDFELTEEGKTFLAEKLTDEFFKSQDIAVKIGELLEKEEPLRVAIAMRVVRNLADKRQPELNEFIEHCVDGIMKGYDVRTQKWDS